MDIKQVRYFVAIADSGSFSAGAKRAFVTQPTLSAAIAALETELAVRLFERRARGVVLTAEGTRALAHARAILRETQSMTSAGRQPATLRPLRVGLLPTLPPELVAGTLARLRGLDPARAWHTEDAPAVTLHQRLAGGRYDAILTSLGKPRAGHRQVELARDSLALAVPKRMRPTGRVTPQILDGKPLVVRMHCELLHAGSRILDNWHVRPVVVARTDSDARALAMVGAGWGACLMPDSMRHDDVVFVRPQGVTLPRRLGIEWIRGVAGGWLDSAAIGL